MSGIVSLCWDSNQQPAGHTFPPADMAAAAAAAALTLLLFDVQQPAGGGR